MITGASRGIGRSVALAAAAKGARVGLIARDKADLEAVLAEAGGQGAIAVADVADPDQLQAAHRRARGRARPGRHPRGQRRHRCSTAPSPTSPPRRPSGSCA